MKPLTIILSFVLLLKIVTFGQDVIHLDPHNITYEPNVILLKFKDEVQAPGKMMKGNSITGVNSIDQLNSTYQVKSFESLFPNHKKTNQNLIQDYYGNTYKQPKLENIYKLEYESNIDAKELADIYSQNENIEYAEPDYHFYALSTYPDDPLYQSGYQSYLDAIHAPEAWDITTGDTSIVIAIIDTGVDWLHPDLDNNIFVNRNEIPDNGLDDDGNGYLDDYWGWNFINNSGQPNDDNSHGTHVAGIVAAEGNNGVGVTGISWNSKIMILKTMDANGIGTASNIAQAINYATANGANIINLSLGGYFESGLIKDALINAYVSNIILVAAAGNDGLDIEFVSDPNYIPEGHSFPEYPMFPACYPFVLGVKANASFSNRDNSGAFNSKYQSELYYNYEITAPGSAMSTVPQRNGSYKNMSGTSMAAPMVSGACALLKAHEPSLTIWQIWLRLIMSSSSLDINAALNYVEPEPELALTDKVITDSAGDNDGIPDAGELIEIEIEAINLGGGADSCWAKLSLDSFEDPNIVDIQTDSIWIGSISSVARRRSQSPFELLISSNAAQGQVIHFNIDLFANGTKFSNSFSFQTEHGTNLVGVLTDTMHLTPDRYWIVNNSFKVYGPNAILIVDPGTNLLLDGKNISLENGGKFIVNGKSDSLCNINVNGNPSLTIDSVNYAHIYCNNSVFYYNYINNSKISALKIYDPITIGSSNSNSIIINSDLSFSQAIVRLIDKCKLNISVYNNNFMADTVKNSFINMINPPLNIYRYGGGATYGDKNTIIGAKGGQQVRGYIVGNYNNYVNSINLKYNIDEIGVGNNFIAGVNVVSSSPGAVINSPNIYWGTTDSTRINNLVYDFWDNNTLAIFDYKPISTKPSAEANGIVWQVKIDGLNPLDDSQEPLGVGTHKFEVYFNRAMDIEFTPLLTFGVYTPYLQNVVADSASWSADSTVWTAYKTFDLKTGDGINRIRVSRARDTNGMEIPVEQYRFDILIDAAGSQSTTFFANADIGKVDLEWPTADQVDLLGYNIYRSLRTAFPDAWSSFAQINDELIIDSVYTDYNIIPDSTYKYYYKIVTTDFAESDPSKEVIATPFNASKGDANGDLTVNVLDITTIVSYLLNQNPQPFLSDAADVNNDGYINVLDIVASVNIIMGNNIPKLIASEGEPTLYYDEKTTRIENTNNISALYLKALVDVKEDYRIIPNELMERMEFGYNVVNDTLYLLVYNLNNNQLTKEEGSLFTLFNGKIKNIIEVTASDPLSNFMKLEVKSSEELIPKDFILYQNYPNPFNPTTTIKYGLPKPANVEITIFNILGQRIKTFTLPEQSSGYHQVIWNSSNSYGRRVSTGVYIYQIKTDKWVDQKKMLLLK